jgi:hypothetical protein
MVEGQFIQGGRDLALVAVWLGKEVTFGAIVCEELDVDGIDHVGDKRHQHIRHVVDCGDVVRAETDELSHVFEAVPQVAFQSCFVDLLHLSLLPFVDGLKRRPRQEAFAVHWNGGRL